MALCPCQNETLYWSTFASYKEPLTANYTETVGHLVYSLLVAHLLEKVS